MKREHALLLPAVVGIVALVVFVRPWAPSPVENEPQDEVAQVAQPEPAQQPSAPPMTDVPSLASESPVPRQSFGPLTATDDSGNAWLISLAGAPGGLNAGKAPGAPIIIKTSVYTAGTNEVSVGLVLEGQAGETYRPVVTRNGARRPAPKLRIVNEAGQVVLDDSFEYG